MPASRPRRRAGSPEQRAAAAAARTQRLEGLHQTLVEGVAAIRDGQAWRDWLDTAARFPSYSFNNQILLSAQQATGPVAGYRAWAAMGRQVRKGEKALYILAPVTRRPPRPDPDTGTDTGTDTDAAAEVEELPGASPADSAPDPAAGGRGRGSVVGFTAVAVFQLSQTDGDPLPAPPAPQLLEGHAPPGLWEAVVQVITARGFTVGRSPSTAELGGANGITDFAARTVTIRGDVDDAMAVKTLCHEAGHVLLHSPPERAGGGPVCRGLIEVEAESVAYLVAAHHGLPTDDYSFAYIAGWAGRDHDAVTGTARRVLDTARTLIEATDPATTADPEAVAGLAATAAAGVVRAQATAAVAAAGHARLAGGLDPAAGRARAVLVEAQAWLQAQARDSGVFTERVTARGYTVAEALGYGLGFAPASWTGLVDHLRNLGHPDTDLVNAGVAAATRHGRCIDRFRGRVTFPLHDQLGVVGFTARDTTGQPAAPKYVNSPASGLFDKSRLLFGTQHLPTGGIDAQTITTIVLAEGPWDALAVTHAGGGDVVGLAACGTAVTDHHLATATTGGRVLVLAPDTDPAGITALGRTLTRLAQHNTGHPGAVVNPTGKDLGELLATAGPAAVRAALAAARPAGVVYAQAHLAHHPPGEHPEARVAAARAAAAHTTGLTVGQRADLAAVLLTHARISPDAALAIVTPRDHHPKPAAAAAAGAPAAPVAARPALRR